MTYHKSTNQPILIAIICVLLNACGSEQSASNNRTDIVRQDSNSTLQPVTTVQEVTFKNLRGEPLGRIDGESLTVAGSEIRYKYGSSGKRKYVNDAGQTLVKIKRSDRNKMKLKTESGVLLWKVKRKPGSIKIANNEEMTQAFKIKFTRPEKAKVLQNEQPLFEVKSDGASVTNNNSNLIDSNNPVTIAIMSLDDIPLLHRLVIIKELAD